MNCCMCIMESRMGSTTRSFLFAVWSEKYERIEYEIKRCETRMESLERRQRMLKLDAWMPIIRIIIELPILYFLVSMIEYIPWVFTYFYIPVLILIIIFTFIRNIFCFAHRLARIFYHKRKNLPFEYPKPILIDSNYPVNILPNHYTERLCCEWLLEKYSYELGQLKRLRKEIEQASEEDYEDLQNRLEEITIYEIIGGAD